MTMLASRAGLEMDAGAKATYNGVQIGRVGAVKAIEAGGKQEAELTLEVDPRYLALIPERRGHDQRHDTVRRQTRVAD
ncbi:ABC-type transporter Mla subunit MlaD [Mycobacterium sp. URHB0021]